MTISEQHKLILQVLADSSKPFTLENIRARAGGCISQRTLHRRLEELVQSGKVVQEGRTKGRVYRLVKPGVQVASGHRPAGLINLFPLER